MKVLFIYPNHKGMNMLPPGVALLSACLKREGHQVQLFDTTYYNNVSKDTDNSVNDSDVSKSERLMARPFEMPKHVVTVKYSNVFEDFKKFVDDFQPDLMALSCTEDMFSLGIDLINQVKHKEILTVAGGVYPTFAPRLILENYSCINIVCKGEGEYALTELCKRLENKQSYDDIANLWVRKSNGAIVVNQTSMIDMDDNPLIDMSLFEEARFYRPMGGKVYRMFPVETHRGCPYKCAFCNSPSQMAMYRTEQGKSYLRRKSFDNMRAELLYYKEEMKAEYLYFWADTFFSWTRADFEEFYDLYQDIKLPFWCQTRPETITEYRVKKLKDMGCARISFGVEHGNEEFRAKHLDRKMKNEVITKGLNTVAKGEIPFSVNNIIGFPLETRELAFDTIRLNKTFEADDRNAYPFTPFTGTPLRKTAELLGLVKETDVVQSMVASGSILDMQQFPRNEVNGLCKTFNMYVKFPEEKWDKIRLAEQETKEGQKAYQELKDEFIQTFWTENKKPSNSFEEGASEIDPFAT
jgi:anaerobic magnesium-protoporphyrin IX monomethyl ester cyclase